ncbi:MAG: hypothetical protein ACKOX6_01850 [Bdellovibrio sp.]
MLELLLMNLAFAKEIPGYQMKDKSSLQHIEGRIVKMAQSDSEYFIQIGIHAALYTFPKSQDKDQKILRTLERLQKEKKSIKAKIDLSNAKIISLEL